MDDDAGDEEEPLPTGHWTATSSYDIYMVDTPKEGNGDEIAEDDPSKKQPKHQRQRRCSKSRQSKSGDTNTGDNNTPDSAEDNNNPLQQDLEQEDGGASPPERAADGEAEDDNYMPPSLHLPLSLEGWLLHPPALNLAGGDCCRLRHCLECYYLLCRCHHFCFGEI